MRKPTQQYLESVVPG